MLQKRQKAVNTCYIAGVRNLFLSTEIVLLGHKWFNLQLFKQDPSVSSFPKLFN